MLERLLKRKGERQELIAAAFYFANKAFKSEEDRRFLERKRKMLKEVLEDSWIYQQVLAEGREKGLEEGREKGLEEGREEEARKNIEALVQARFPELLATVQDLIAPLKDLAKFQEILIRAGTARTEDEFRTYLATCSREA